MREFHEKAAVLEMVLAAWRNGDEIVVKTVLLDDNEGKIELSRY